jgi:hypothetical protein
VNLLPTPRRRGRHCCRPQVESLEDRSCPTVSGSPFKITGTTLAITGDSRGVSVRYEGVTLDPKSHLPHGLVWASADGSGTFFEIDKVVINTPDGAPSGPTVPVSFRLDAPLTTAFTLEADLGANNAADLDFSAGIQGVPVYLDLKAAGGDTVTSRFGTISNNSSQKGVIFNATLGSAGYNTFVSDLDGNLTGGSINYTVQGGNAGNFLAVNAGTAAYAGANSYVPKTSITVDPNSAVSVDLRGGTGDDTIVTQFVGTLDGKYGRLLTGHDVPGSSSELAATDIILPGSTGVYHGAIRGGDGNDHIAQYLGTPKGGDGGSLQSLVCWVDTYAGHDTVNVSPGIAVYHDGANPGIQNF